MNFSTDVSYEGTSVDGLLQNSKSENHVIDIIFIQKRVSYINYNSTQSSYRERCQRHRP